MAAPQLPNWLTVSPKGVMVVDIDKAYPAVLGALGVADGEVNDYWKEVAFQCAKMAVQDIVSGTELAPYAKQTAAQIAAGEPPQLERCLVIDMQYGASKDRWALKEPNGKDVQRATKGREARVHYERIRRRLVG